MARSAMLEVDVVASHELPYDLEASPLSTHTVSNDELSPNLSNVHFNATQPSSSTTPSRALSPSIRLLFSLISPRDRVVLLLPAFLSSLIAGGIAPFMTYIIGQVFDAFAKFPRDPNPSQAAKDTLLRNVGIGALGLIGLAVGSLALSSVTSCLWIWLGERNTMAVRQQVYYSITRKEMAWYDTKMSSESTEEGPLGAGGLMAKFTRDTDDVRMASSLASGMLVQCITTVVACLILGFIRSWALTLVILSSVPILMIIQGLSQALAGPPLSVERRQSGLGGTVIDRATNAIATVKAFNAGRHEMLSFSRILATMAVADRKLNAVWGLTSGLSRFAMMAMFVQGFWFGGKLVREGKIAPGDVMAVFWACLIATSNLQMCIPQFILLAKGQFAMVSLLSLVDGDTDGDSNPSPDVPVRRSGLLRKILPSRCLGELALHDVTFAYPSRPQVIVLDNVSLYLPANEMTFICGGSGSGKSTIAQLLLQLYTPQLGSLQLDDQKLHDIDMNWARRQIAAVTQDCILFDMSVHANVAMSVAGVEGRRPEDVTREEVIEACRAALLHDFIRELPQGYDTYLGTGGFALSGGQRQRLAIARAKLRNPPILVLDEATSALDPTSRVLVFEAIKRWRAGKTTVVITHDLSQISRNDFAYVLKDGQVAEQGYRYDLETSGGEFERMTVSHGVTGGFLPVKEVGNQEEDIEAILQQQDPTPELRPFSFARDSMFPISNRLTMGNWMFGAVSDLTNPKSQIAQKHQSSVLTPLAEEVPRRRRRPSSIQIIPLPPPPSDRPLTRRYSLEFEPASAVSNVFRQEHELDEKLRSESAQLANSRRVRRSHSRWDEEKLSVVTPTFEESQNNHPKSPLAAPPTFLQLMAAVYPNVPYKPLVAFGLFVCVLSGAMTPVFSFLLSRLLHEVSIGAQNYSYINLFGGIVLSVAALDGILMGLQYFLMETSAMLWVMRMRKLAFERVLAQDKKWFDKTEHSPVRLVQMVMKDGDDSRNLIAVVLGQAVVVFTMLSVGLIWALVRGWQLTLVGIAIGPIFGVTMAFQSRLVATCELNNKRAREDVAKIYYETVSNMRGIRSMTLESVFERQFSKSTDHALSTGVQGAFVEGCTYGVANGLIYVSEALLFYVGAILISRGTYTYLRMIEVLNLVVFTVTIGSQLLAFTEKIAKSVQATRDIHELITLETDSDESRGTLRPHIDGSVVFSDVSFAYPERPDVPVLKGLSLEIFAGESVAIVGTSGSGKTTLGALLQRLYEPKTGAIYVGGYDIRSTDVNYLRQHVGVVSQSPHLFDASIFDNIVYGDDTLSPIDVRRAAKAAHAHDFIMNLPNGYDTTIGENASLVSGGQAQRLQIARALARPSKILILDECTSALDSANQAAVMDAIFDARAGRTLLMVTHKLPIMKQCDRIVLVHEGQIAEQGSFNELMARRGLFTTLLRGGEWLGD